MNFKLFFACIIASLIIGASLCTVQIIKNSGEIELENLRARNKARLLNDPQPKIPRFEVIKGNEFIPTILIDNRTENVFRYYRNLSNNVIKDEGWQPLNP